MAHILHITQCQHHTSHSSKAWRCPLPLLSTFTGSIACIFVLYLKEALLVFFLVLRMGTTPGGYYTLYGEHLNFHIFTMILRK